MQVKRNTDEQDNSLYREIKTRLGIIWFREKQLLLLSMKNMCSTNEVERNRLSNKGAYRVRCDAFTVDTHKSCWESRSCLYTNSDLGVSCPYCPYHVFSIDLVMPWIPIGNLLRTLLVLLCRSLTIFIFGDYACHKICMTLMYSCIAK